MSACSNINQLPDEMLLKIFEAMGSETLKKSSHVCKRWNELIGQSIKVMEKLPLSLEGPWNSIYQSTKDFTRKFHTINIDNADEWSNKALKLAKKHGTETRLLKFCECSFEIEKLNVINKLIDSFKKLEELQFSNVAIESSGEIDEEFSKIPPVHLPHLKSIVHNESSCALFAGSGLTSIKINCECQNVLSSKLEAFWTGQKKLQVLALRDFVINDDSMSLEKIREMKFPLKKLSLLQVSSDANSEKLVAFLENFVKTLQELEISKYFPEAIYEMIFKKFLHLKSLKINITYVPVADTFYHNLRPNPSVTKLIIGGFTADHQKQVEGFVGNLPNIETLVIDSTGVPKQLMMFVANNLLKLKNLHVKEISGKMVDNVTISRLKSLHIKNLTESKATDWKAIVKAFPNVEHLSIEKVIASQVFNDLIFNIITKGWKNLKHLKIGTGFIAKKRIFNQLLANSKLIQTVELAESAFKSAQPNKNGMIKDFKKDGLRLIIHSDDEMKTTFIDPSGSLWSKEEVDQFYDSDDEDDEDDDDPNNIGWMVMGQLLHAFGSFDDSDNDSDDDHLIYFDSDGEMRRWDEDPSDYGYYDDNFFFVD